MNFNTKQLFEAKIYEPLVKSFEKLTDLRCARGIRYQLKPVIILLFLSKLGGADTPAEIADWVGFRFEFFKSMLALNWKRSPHARNLAADFGKRHQCSSNGSGLWRVFARFEGRRAKLIEFGWQSSMSGD